MASLIRDPFGDAVLMRKAYGDALVELGRARKDLVVLSADVQSSDFSYLFEEAFPDRFFNVGIAEPSLVDCAAGLANSGKVPVANTFACFIATRALEMVRTHLCYPDVNVKLAGAYAGLSDSFDGPTHHSITDVAILRSLPRMTVVRERSRLRSEVRCRYRSARLYLAVVQLLSGQGESVWVLWSTTSRSVRISGSPRVRLSPKIVLSWEVSPFL